MTQLPKMMMQSTGTRGKKGRAGEVRSVSVSVSVSLSMIDNCILLDLYLCSYPVFQVHGEEHRISDGWTLPE